MSNQLWFMNGLMMNFDGIGLRAIFRKVKPVGATLIQIPIKWVNLTLRAQLEAGLGQLIENSDEPTGVVLGFLRRFLMDATWHHYREMPPLS